MTEPTYDELAKLFTEETGFDVDDFPAAILGFARAVLDKWGQPAHSGEPLTHAQAKALVSKYGNDLLHLVYQVEAAHGIGIKGGQHGAE